MKFLEEFALANEEKIQNWINSKLKGKNSVLYSSCDVRYSGFKITQVDANCFPAGFNNLNLQSYKAAVQSFTEFFLQKKIKSVLIYPEFHTRNFGYLKNIKTLKAIFEEAGAKVKIATNLENKFNIDLSTSDIKSISEELGLPDNSLEFDPIKKCKWFFQKKYKLGVTSNDCTEIKPCCFVADVVVLNNDLSSGMPDILNNIQTVVLPSPKMGWWNRKKTEHFKAYSAIVQDFAKEFNLDPWLFDGYFEEVSDINFKEGKNYEDLKDKISILYNKIQAKYREYGISKNPSIFIKSNRGTYGMGVHVIQSPEEVLEFNKNIRKKMSTTKDGIENTSVIIQEGVETIFKTDDGKAVEPVVYSAISKPIGMFFRINDGFLSNLNSKGMELTNEFPLTKPQTILINLIGGLTNLAITREMEEKLSK